MALVVGLREGEDVYLSKNGADVARVVLTEIYSPTHFQIKVERATIDHIMEIDDQRVTKVIQDVSVQAGLRGDLETARLAIDAPRSIVIERGTYRRKHEHNPNR